MTDPPLALFESFLPGPQGRSFRFDSLVRILIAASPAEVLPLLAEVEQATIGGLHAAGFVSYEAAPGLDPTLATYPPGDLPLVWFALFRERHEVEPGTISLPTTERLLQPRPSWDAGRYAQAFATVQGYIAAGDSYQVNLTFEEHFRFSGDPFGFYRRLCAAQPAAFCAWLDLGDHAIASASPELFFARHGDSLVMRPMKGTALRGSDPIEDQHRRRHLADSPKERAENLMIVDLVRNDLGRIATTGSVAVPKLFAVESYPTLHQMTSTVTANILPDTGVGEIFRALFPCGSVTGAPKRRSIAIIEELESRPRGVYCGAIGFVSPGDEMVFNVAIRTALLDRRHGCGTLGIGSGVTADAVASAEYRECLDKARFLTQQAESLALVETLRWEPGKGFLLLERHLRRLASSARCLDFPCDVRLLTRKLHAAVGDQQHHCKVRLLLATDGTTTVSVDRLPVPARQSTPPQVTLATTVIDRHEPLLYHKTTWRPWYAEVLQDYPGCLDVLFCNAQDEVTEGTFHNLVVEKAGRLVTPPVACGLLPGTLREELLERGILTEEPVTRMELLSAPRLWLINSVRGWRRVVLRAAAA